MDPATRWPLISCLAAFLITFLVTRAITRMIRAGKGPFRDNVTTSGVHIHHAVPGLILLLTGAVISLASTTEWVNILAGLAVGAGASLVLDEFALILHLEDVYWEQEGQASVQAVALVAVCIGLITLGFTPVTNADFSGDTSTKIAAWVTVLLHLGCAVTCALKGKYRLLVIGAIIPTVAIFGAIRLAKPRSWWARRRYAAKPAKQARAERRDVRLSRVWGKRWVEFADVVAGRPDPDQAAASTGSKAAAAAP